MNSTAQVPNRLARTAPRASMLARAAALLAVGLLFAAASTQLTRPDGKAKGPLDAGGVKRASAAALAPPTPRQVAALSTVVARRYRISAEATREFVEAAVREAKRHQVDPLLVLALIAVESRFNPVAQSSYGATGLMQIIPRFHRHKLEVPGASLLDPSTNIQLGTRVLREYIERGGSEVAGLQLYNGAAADTTSAYANKVLIERERLRQAVRTAKSSNGA